MLNSSSLAQSVEFGQDATGDPNAVKVRGADLANASIAGKYSGYSEAWSKSTFDAESIKELMRLTEDWEAQG